jgi:septal ring factor EnvC (AmiA/AmiB activator)
MDKKKLLKLASMLSLTKEIKTDEGAVLLIAGDVALGEEVFVTDESGNMVPAPDGTYTSEGKIIVVAAGKITEVKDAETAPADEEKPAEETAPKTEETEEEKPAEEETPSEETEDVEALKARIAELETENEALKAKIKELEEKTPAAPSIEDEDKKEKKFKKQDESKSFKERLLAYAYGKQN